MYVYRYVYIHKDNRTYIPDPIYTNIYIADIIYYISSKNYTSKYKLCLAYISI